MKKVKMLIFILVAIGFVLLPFPASDLYIRIHFTEIAGNDCGLYYTTKDQPVFSQEQYIPAPIDHEKKSVSFCLDGSLENKLTGLRLDFANQSDLVQIKSITLSSAGVVQKEYNPCVFFAEENVTHINQAEIIPIPSRNRVCISTSDNDPYVIFSDGLVGAIKKHYSHMIISRICVCLFIAGCYLMAKKHIFTHK